MRTEPPPAAVWTLEHLLTGEYREEVIGDLFEEYRCGRSNAWFWRQTLSASLTSWAMSLQPRLPMLFFALVWSLAAPAWHLICDHAVSTTMTVAIERLAGGLWVLPALFVWTLLHSAFIWIGALLYSALHGTFDAPLHPQKARQGYLLVPLVLDFTYGLTFCIVGIYFYSIPGLAQQHLTTTPLGRILDTRLLPDLMRLPYCVAMIAALWRAIETSPVRRSKKDWIVPCAGSDEALLLASNAEPMQNCSASGLARLLAIAGAMNALLIGLLLCRLPEFHFTSLPRLLLRASITVIAGVCGGIGGIWLYWKSPWSPYRAQMPFSLRGFIRTHASAWAWAPVVAYLAEQLSPATALAAALSCYMLISAMYRSTPLLQTSSLQIQDRAPDNQLLFSELFVRPQQAWSGFSLAAALYAGCTALLLRAHLIAAACFAFGAGVLAWNHSTASSIDSHPAIDNSRWQICRQSFVFLGAVLFTAWAMLDVDSGTHSALTQTSSHQLTSTRQSTGSSAESVANNHLSGYESIILWPYPEKKAVVVPLPKQDYRFLPGVQAPLTVRFNGSYQYFQFPNKVPGPNAHQANGSPLTAGIESSSSAPVAMTAHQWLARPVRIADCAAMQVDTLNHDNIAGAIFLAILLRDSSSSRTLYLGQKVLPSTLPASFATKSEAVADSLQFSFPTQSALKRFDQISVVILSGKEHALVAPKVSIEQFRILPR